MSEETKETKEEVKLKRFIVNVNFNYRMDRNAHNATADIEVKAKDVADAEQKIEDHLSKYVKSSFPRARKVELSSVNGTRRPKKEKKPLKEGVFKRDKSIYNND